MTCRVWIIKDMKVWSVEECKVWSVELGEWGMLSVACRVGIGWSADEWGVEIGECRVWSVR